jgi:hypothetical protein
MLTLLSITIITIITSESTGDSATASLTTANWQYSRDNVTWYDIDSTAIGNNSANTPGGPYTITWNTTAGANNLRGGEKNG